MDGGAGGLSRGEESRDDGVRVLGGGAEDLSADVGGNSACCFEILSFFFFKEVQVLSFSSSSSLFSSLFSLFSVKEKSTKKHKELFLTHVVVDGGQDGDGLLGDVDAGFKFLS